jgi:predicted HNH restriction endonuclease
MTTTSTKQTIVYHPNRTPWTQETPLHLQSEQSFIMLTPWTQERPRHLQNKQLSIILTELPEHKKDHDIYKANTHLSSWQNSLNTRKTTTSTKQTIIHHPNRTPWTQERSWHLQNKQSSIILTPWTQERPRHLQSEQSSFILAPWTEKTPRHLQNKQSSIILTELHEHKNDHDIYKANNHLWS